MKKVYETLNNVQTQLLAWDEPFSCNGKDVIICITGNPGVVDFYEEFGTALNDITKLPVCIIGQAGHEDLPSNVLQGREHLFNLQGQLKHKIDLIDNYIDKDSKFHFIGHSIGAWIVIEILQKETRILQRVKSINLLFPTIQKMAQTRNGFYLNNFTRYIHTVIILFLTLIYLLPEKLKLWLIGIYVNINSLPKHYTKRILKYVNPRVMEKVLMLAYDEMDSVNFLNIDGINAIKHCTNVIYSNHDNWAPTSYIEDLKVFQPSLKLLELDVEHSFVLKSSAKVAEVTAQFIQTKVAISN